MTGMGTPSPSGRDAPLRLHLGGREARPGWSIFNIQPGPGVDFVGDCADLSRFPDGSAAEVYASHVYEHLSYRQLPAALAHVHRVLRPGGLLRLSVPDLDTLCTMFLDRGLPLLDRFEVQRMMYGGQVDPDDYHRCGLNFELLASLLSDTGFRHVRRVESFNLFDDTSAYRFCGRLISLNVQALK
jgi:predicted SAM-dependent methyltransferase